MTKRDEFFADLQKAISHIAVQGAPNMTDQVPSVTKHEGTVPVAGAPTGVGGLPAVAANATDGNVTIAQVKALINESLGSASDDLAALRKAFDPNSEEDGAIIPLLKQFAEDIAVLKAVIGGQEDDDGGVTPGLIDRLEALEGHTAVRKSLTGAESITLNSRRAMSANGTSDSSDEPLMKAAGINKGIFDDVFRTLRAGGKVELTG